MVIILAKCIGSYNQKYANITTNGRIILFMRCLLVLTNCRDRASERRAIHGVSVDTTVGGKRGRSRDRDRDR